MQKELKMLLDSFIAGNRLQPILVNDSELEKIISYITGKNYLDLQDIKNSNIGNIYFFETDEKVFKKEISLEIVTQASIKSYFDYSIFVIREMEKMSIGASNALLKILEDVPEKLLFLLTSDAKENLLDTIKSRVIDFNKNTENFELDTDIRQLIDEYYTNKKIDFIKYLMNEKIERHEYIAILEYILSKSREFLLDSNKMSELLDGISTINSSNASPKYILDGIILE